MRGRLEASARGGSRTGGDCRVSQEQVTREQGDASADPESSDSISYRKRGSERERATERGKKRKVNAVWIVDKVAARGSRSGSSHWFIKYCKSEWKGRRQTDSGALS